MSSVLITGVSGFIGRFLAKRMLADGWNVRGVARNAGAPASAPGMEMFAVRAINGETDWSGALDGIDMVVHLAARTHATREAAADVLTEYRSTNVAGTGHLARSSAASGVKRFIYVSSVKVNGEGRDTPYAESDMPRPEDPYGISKWEGEQVLTKIGAETGMDTVIIRPPLVYGPHMKANFLQLMNIVDRGIPLPFAGVDNRRSFLYVGNLVDALSACAVRAEAANKIYLVSDGEAVSTAELIRRIARALGKTPRLFPAPEKLIKLAGSMTGRSSAVDRLLGSLTVDSSRIARELAWKAPFSMDRGLHETAEWYRTARSY